MVAGEPAIVGHVKVDHVPDVIVTVTLLVTLLALTNEKPNIKIKKLTKVIFKIFII